jgi:mersacidin/lichenicidin family type 2 lantibiotic
MSMLEIIRAWKDEDYRLSLSETERELVPAHPAGVIELTDCELDEVVGGGCNCSCCCIKPSDDCEED